MENKLVEKAYAKVNLAIDVSGKDTNGYHFVDMIMSGIYLHDVITVSILEGKDIKVECDNPEVPVGIENLCYKAAKNFIDICKDKGVYINCGYKIYIEKHIPMGGGLGGGSTDAATVLKCLNKLNQNILTKDEMLDIAKGLGADVSFSLYSKFARAEHYGEVLSDIEPISEYYCLLINPNINVSTKSIYQDIDNIELRKRPQIDKFLSKITSKDVYYLRQLCYNVLEEVAIGKYPIIGEIKDFINNETNVILSLMSGSGSTVFGLYEKKEDIDYAYEVAGCRFKEFNIIKTKLYTH